MAKHVTRTAYVAVTGIVKKSYPKLLQIVTGIVCIAKPTPRAMQPARVLRKLSNNVGTSPAGGFGGSSKTASTVAAIKTINAIHQAVPAIITATKSLKPQAGMRFKPPRNAFSVSARLFDKVSDCVFLLITSRAMTTTDTRIRYVTIAATSLIAFAEPAAVAGSCLIGAFVIVHTIAAFNTKPTKLRVDLERKVFWIVSRTAFLFLGV